MNEQAWLAFSIVAAQYKSFVNELNSSTPDLAKTIQRLVDKREGPSYTVETPVVYNFAVDDFSPDSKIKLILVADNPGRREQAAENRRYLVGPSGKIADKFFRDNPPLGIDFRKNVLILNKTPIHTPRTIELKELRKLGNGKLNERLIYSQETMARLLFDFWNVLKVPIWIIGYSEMKKNGVFEAYTSALRSLCEDNALFKDSIFLFRHFSMNQFTIDLKKHSLPGEPLNKSLDTIGNAYRKKYLC